MSCPTIPNEDDWCWAFQSPFLDLDIEYAEERFSGLSIEQAVTLFEESVLGASEDVSYMPPVPFRFYLKAFCQYLMAPERAECDESSDGASSFLSLVKRKLEEYPDFIMPAMQEVMPVIEFIGANQDYYDAREDLYGSFAEKAAEIKFLYAARLKDNLAQ